MSNKNNNNIINKDTILQLMEKLLISIKIIIIIKIKIKNHSLRKIHMQIITNHHH